MNFSRLPISSLLGRILRGLLRIIPPKTVLPILQGRLKGTSWIVGSSTMGCWLGSYEYEKRRLFEQIVKEGHVVYDIGANVGFYSLLSSRLVGATGQVFAFEPLESNVLFLKRHLELNRIINTNVLQVAVTEKSGTAFLIEGPTRSMARLADAGDIPVQAVAVDALVNNGDLAPPDVIKIDVEGAELSVLRGAQSTIKAIGPAIFVATHSDEIKLEVYEWLVEMRYKVEEVPSDPDELVAMSRNEN